MTDCRRAENTCLLRWQLHPLTAALLALSATPLLAAAQSPGYGQDSIAGLPVYAAEESTTSRGPVGAVISHALPASATASAPDREPRLSDKTGPGLPNIDSAGDRLGWMTRAEIAQLPAIDRPVLDATCEGAWVTPISPSVIASKLEETDVKAMADSLSYRDNGEAVLEGQVRLQQPGRLVEADSGYLTQDRDYARFDGNIRLAEPGLLLTGCCMLWIWIDSVISGSVNARGQPCSNQ